MGQSRLRRAALRAVLAGVVAATTAGCATLRPPGRRVAATATRVGALPLGAGIVAKDLGFSVANDATVRYFFGDTLGLLNADGTVASNSGAEASRSDPFAALAFAGGQVVPFTPYEAGWNLRPGPDRWGIPIMGAVREGPADARLFYAVDQPSNAVSVHGRAFYAQFPMRRLGTTVLPAAAEVAPRDEVSETWLALDEWPVGFHRLPDGRVRFFVQMASDTESTMWFRRATWSAGDGFAIEPEPLFALDAVAGLAVFRPIETEPWLAAWIDARGVVRLSVLDDAGRPSRAAAAEVHRIPGWKRPWDGYAMTHVDGADADGGWTVHLLFSRSAGVLRSELPILRVTIERLPE